MGGVNVQKISYVEFRFSFFNCTGQHKKLKNVSKCTQASSLVDSTGIFWMNEDDI